jgi:hypothetical protein
MASQIIDRRYALSKRLSLPGAARASSLGGQDRNRVEVAERSNYSPVADNITIKQFAIRRMKSGGVCRSTMVIRA